MPLHHPNQVRVERHLKLVLRDFLDAIDQAPTIGAIEKGLGIGRTELNIGDDVGRSDLHREQLKPRRGANRLAMNRGRANTLGHTDLQHKN
jgi:hypothetical protein